MGEKSGVVSTNNLVMETSESGKKLPQYIAALSVCMGSVAAGTVLGWTANISDALKTGGLNDIYVDDDVLGWIGSFATLGAMCMCFPIGFICDRIGRKPAMLLTIIPFCVGWLLIMFASGVGMIYAGRFLTGMAGGAFCVSAPLYTSEIAEKEVRGALGSYFQLLLTVGILLAYVLGACLSPKTFTAICAVVPLVFGAAFSLQPETPAYCMRRGDEQATRAALRRLRGGEYDVEGELAALRQQQLEQDGAAKAALGDALKKPETKRALVICFGLMFFQQLSGINAVIFYTDTIFKAAGSSLPSATATIIVGVMQVAATFVSTMVVDRFGRRILLLGSDLLMVLSGATLGLFFSLKDRQLVDESTVDAISFIPVVALCVFIVVFSLGFGPIPWMISAEVFPAEIKSNASSAAGTFNWFLAFLVTKFYLTIKEAIKGDSTFYLFSLISLLGTIFVFFCCPETKGKTLDEIQVELSGRKPMANKRGIDNNAFSS